VRASGSTSSFRPADAVLFLASSEASYVTVFAALPVDGGLTGFIRPAA
jgi:hypothetical protein